MALSRLVSTALLVLGLISNLRADTFTFTTFAGPQGGVGSFDGQGTEARFQRPYGVATDSAGNVYVGDGTHTVRRITPTGLVTTLAGMAGFSGAVDGTGNDARFKTPRGLAVDGGGNVYVAEYASHTIRKITPAGVVTTLAGLAGTPGTDNGAGSAARFRFPQGVAVDGSGNVYVADVVNHAIRKITPAGSVSTFAGAAGASGNTDGDGPNARFNLPWGIAIDAGGNLYVADTGNSTIRKITPAAVVSTLQTIGGSNAIFSGPSSVAVGTDGSVYVTAHSTSSVMKLATDGTIQTVAGMSPGYEDGVGTQARFSFSFAGGVAVDAAGNLFVADLGNSAIRKIVSGAVTTFAGLPGPSGSIDGARHSARFNSPADVVTDVIGNVYVADTFNHVVRKITPEGEVSTFAGQPGFTGSTNGNGADARFSQPAGIAIDDSGNLYVSDTGNHTLRKISPSRDVSTFAGSPGLTGATDGAPGDARFNNPGFLVFSGGYLYVADSGNHTIRRIASDGTVSTYAGAAGMRGSTDGSLALARFDFPKGITADGNGNLYVMNNRAVRKISGGSVSTIAGLAGVNGAVDGNGTDARFSDPVDIAATPGGDVFVADGNHVIRRVTSAGVVSTVGGTLRPPPLEDWQEREGSADGTAAAARFKMPYGLYVHGNGDLYVADFGNHKIRVGRPALADVATCEVAAGTVGVQRQLGSSPQQAASWHWAVVRRPGGSTASLTSSSVRAPFFTPDVLGLYTFRLIATGATATSITTVDHLATGPAPGELPVPTGFSASASGSDAVNLVWNAVSGATHYEVHRSTNGTTFDVVAMPTAPSHTDLAVSANASYLYRVRAVGSGGSSGLSARDVATTVLFTDHPLIAGVFMKAAHVVQLGTAATAIRSLAGLGAYTPANTIETGAIIRAADITDVRSAISEARAILGVPSVSYAETLVPQLTTPKAVHIMEVRSAVD